jgi:UDP-N-acetylglucosamine--N-acetylmuramyl-(pentapeptide) pyrophosphoryl-undecaprenol N-acetylglucosamine transferase
MKRLRILFTGGGSGGHIFPLIAVANELEKQAANFNIALDMQYFGSDRKYAEELVKNNIAYIPVLTSKWRRYWSLLNIVDLIKFPFSIIQLLWKIFWFMPDVVFSKGGPGALAVIWVSRFYLIPVVIHESDTIPGLTSRISGRYAKKIFLAFAAAEEYFGKKNNIEIVGNPVRESLIAQVSELGMRGKEGKSQARKEFGLNPDESAILVLGGSQGAERINNFVLENLETLIQNFQVIHQVGEGNFPIYKKEFEFIAKEWSEIEKSRYQYRPFFAENLADAMVAADIVISRAGAGSIFELAAFGKPAILVPLPESANDHQKQNAYLYSQTGAALVIQEENLLGNLMVVELEKLFKEPALLQQMGDAARSFYRPEAASIIAKYLLTYI